MTKQLFLENERAKNVTEAFNDDTFVAVAETKSEFCCFCPLSPGPAERTRTVLLCVWKVFEGLALGSCRRLVALLIFCITYSIFYILQLLDTRES